MDEVVDGGAGADVHEIAEHEEVRGEEEEGEEEPACVEMLVGEKSGEEEGGFFDAEEGGGAGEHRWFIRDFGGRWFGCSGKTTADSSAALRNNNKNRCGESVEAG